MLPGIAQTTAALTRLKPVWNDRSISLNSKMRLMRSLITSIFLYACNHGPSQQGFKEESGHMKIYWRSYGDAKCSGMVMFSVHLCLDKTILQGTVQGGRKGRQRKKWEDNIMEWTGLEFAKCQRAMENREKWRKLVVKSSVVPQRPSRLRDRWWDDDDFKRKCRGN